MHGGAGGTKLHVFDAGAVRRERRHQGWNHRTGVVDTMRQIRIRKTKRPAAPTDVDLRTPAGRVLPY